MSFFTDSTIGIVIDIFFILIFSAYLFWIWGLLRALKSDAPYVPMDNEKVRAMVAAAQAPQGARWIDLGSGDGRVLIEAARKYRIRGVGIERIAPLRVWSRIQILKAGVRDVEIRSGDFFHEDLSDYDVVSFYLLPKTEQELIPKLQQELKAGALIIFHRFPIPGLVLEREDTVLKIYVARAPLKFVS